MHRTVARVRLWTACSCEADHPVRSRRSRVGAKRRSSSLGRLLTRGPHQNRTRRLPPSGSSADVSRGYAPQTRTTTCGRGSGNRSSSRLNRSHVRRVRRLRRRSHLNQTRIVARCTKAKLRALPFTPK